MAEWSPEANEIFLRALEVAGPDERRAYLDDACGANAALRERVEKLLRASDRAGSFLESRAAGLSGTAVGGAGREEPGAWVGPYKLLQPVGEGGMGAVWMAEQARPVRRKVALKVIRAGLDSKQVVARFEAERQALALMDHPHIAKVLDGGATEQGRPYFVMELVKGVPITKFCDERRLTVRERLELFVPVCAAVQHAHQKGIIHRDLKPSNVLVALYDGRPAPKVIDFGVAKATGPKLTERTLFTEFGAVVGTLEYMSPEQAELNQLDIDTRSDVYSLGVLLYELLTGTTPLGPGKEGGLLEVLRRVREEEPPTPSARLSTTEELPAIAASRGLEPRKLSGLLRGELDWIVLKALEKDRDRRYESANALAADLGRYLNDEPVLACPPSPGYRLRKFVRRHKRGLATAVVLGVGLLASVGATAGGIGWAARDRAEQRSRLNDAVSRALEDVGDHYRRGRLPDAWAALERAQGLLDSGGGGGELRRQVLGWRTDLELVNRLEAIPTEIGAAQEGWFDFAGGDRAYREAFRRYGLDVEASDPGEAAEAVRAAAIKDHLVAGLDRWVLMKRDHAGLERLLAVVRRADPDPWRDRLRDACRRGDRQALVALAGDRDLLAQPLPTLLLLSAWLKNVDAFRAAEVYRLAQRRHPGDFWVNVELASLLLQIDRAEVAAEAIACGRAAVALRPESPVAYVVFGNVLMRYGRPAPAEAEFREALRLRPGYAVARYHIGLALWQQGRRADAEGEYREAVRLMPDYATAHYGLGGALRARGLKAEAEAAFREAARLRPDVAEFRGEVGNVLSARGRHAEAEAEYRAAARLAPDRATHRFNLGHLLYQQHNYPKAVAELREAARLQPDNIDAHHFLGRALVRQDKLPEAAAEFRAALRLKPGLGLAHNDLGNVLYRQRNYPAAEAEFRAAVRLLPDDPGARYNLGCVLYDRGRWADAAAELRAALGLRPGHGPAHYALGLALAKQGKLDEAVEELGEAGRLQPEAAKAPFALGSVLARGGRWAEAVAAYRRGLERDPGNHYSWYRTAVLCLYAGDGEGYRRTCAALLERFGGTADPAVALRAAQACTLAPDGTRDPQRARRLADRAVPGGAGRRASRSLLLAKALADYRAGRHAAAAERLKQFTPKADGAGPDATAFAVVALARHRLGQADEARAALAAARAILADKMPAPEKGRPFGEDWDGWLCARLLCREAEAVLKPPGR